MKTLRRTIGIVLGLTTLVCIIAMIALWRAFDRHWSAGGCDSEIISQALSADHAWRALVREEVCGDGAFTTTISDVVHIVGASNDGGIMTEGEVFAVDEGGHPYNRPVIRWLAPRLLEIVVPNKSSIGLRKDTFNGVTIRVRFNPDDPEERRRWLEEIKRGPR
jgi:hypothetical protein